MPVDTHQDVQPATGMGAPNVVDTHDDIQLAQGVEPASEIPEQSASYAKENDLLQPIGKSKMAGDEDLLFDEGLYKAGASSHAWNNKKSIRYLHHDEEGNPIGALQIMTHGPRTKKATIQNVYVAEDHRRKKIASNLLKRARRDFDVKHSSDLTDEGRAFAKAAKAYGGAIPGPRLTEENADDFARRLIAWTFATAPLFQRASGGEVSYPVAIPTEIKEDIKAGKAKMKQLSPQEFLNETDPLHIGKGDRHIIHSFEKHIKSGDHLGPLKIYEEGHQDGRHRANAAKDLGVKKVPVVDYRKAAGGAVDDAQNAIDTARDVNQMGFYSAAAEAASKIPQRAPIDQIINKIKGQPNVKQAELDNANLANAFAGQRSVDPKEVARHLQKNVPQIGETVYGGRPKVKYEPKALLERPKGFENADDVYEVGPHGKPPHLIAVNGDNYDVWGPSGYHNSYDSFQDAVEHANNSIGNVEQPQYKEYTIPGGENYREVLLNLPLKEDAMKTEFHVSGALPDQFDSRQEAESYVQKLHDMAEQNPAIAAKLARFPINITTLRKLIDPKSVYYSPHWKGVENLLAHLRMSDRDNGKTLHIEELQSDWGQEGRKQGFKEFSEEDEKKLLDVHKQHADIMEKMDNAGPDEYRLLSQQRRELENTFRSLNNKKRSAIPSAPYVTDTNQWVDLGLKRALIEAAKGGYDKLIWTPGEEQAKRYDLSKQISKLQYYPHARQLRAFDHNGNNVIDKLDVTPEQLPDFIGKDVAKKLLSDEHAIPKRFEEGTLVHEMRGQDLSVGGEGMKSFYDKLVPQRLDKLVRQYDKDAKVNLFGHDLKTGRHMGPVSGSDIMNQLPETQSMSDDERADWWRGLSRDKRDQLFDDFRSEKIKKFHSIEITPKLREAILKGGLPAFEHGGSVIKAGLDVLSKLRR